MSYDIIETFVGAQYKEMRPAKYVQHEGQIQFEEALPLESEPKMNQLRHYMKQFCRCVGKVEEAFILAGYFLNRIKTEEVYRYPVDEGLQGYTSFYKFCEKEMRIPPTTVKRLLSINLKFCHNEPSLPEGYKRFSASQLGIMSTFQNGLEGKMTPEVTCKQLNNLSKYYSLKGWEVDLKTTWREDLCAYEEYLKHERLNKSRLRKKEFKSVTDEQQEQEEGTKPEALITKRYDAFIKFCERTKEQAEQLKSGKGYTDGLDEILTVLTKQMKKAERSQNEDVLGTLREV